MSARQWDSVLEIPEGATATDNTEVPFKRENGVLYLDLDNGWEVAEPDTLIIADILGTPFTEVIA